MPFETKSAFDVDKETVSASSKLTGNWARQDGFEAKYLVAVENNSA